MTEAGLPFESIPTGKLRRYFSWQNFTDPVKVAAGFGKALSILRWYKPDVVFGKGGFVTLPVVRAAALLRIPVVLHESDVVPGLANRLGAAVATKIAVSFPTELIHNLPAEKLVYTGNPVNRDVITGKAPRAVKRFRLEPNVPVIVVLGGSQGAVSLNKLVEEALPELLDEVQIVHQVGERSAKESADFVKGLKPAARRRYHIGGYFEDRELFDLYAAADIVVARAGVGLTGSIAAVGKPSILVPLPRSVSSHQIANARYYADRGAAVMLTQEEATGLELARLLKQLLHNPQRLAEMGRSTRKLATLDAASKVADLVWEAGTGG